MIDIELIRNKPDWVREQVAKRFDPAAVERIARLHELDQSIRKLKSESESVQAERNKLNKAVGPFRANKSLDDSAKRRIIGYVVEAVKREDYAAALEALKGSTEVQTESEADFNDLNALLKNMGDEVDRKTKLKEQQEDEFRESLLFIPNLPYPNARVGETSAENIIFDPEGEKRAFDFKPQAHWDLGPALDIIDFDRGVKLSGTRFYVLKGMGAKLQRALINLCLDMHGTKGYTELYVPFIVKEDMLFGAGQFPKFRNDIFADREVGLYLLPTAEVAITNLHRDEVLSEADLPLKYMANTPCWRKEATSAGRDVRGIKRVHQFQKVELYQLATPESSYTLHEQMYNDAADVCRALQIPFRKLELCTGDTGFGMAKTYDIEMWSPGAEDWLEVSSCSNAEAFQARRAAIRYRPQSGDGNEYVHTLNCSGLAMPRVLIAILENYQQQDGSVVIPEVLRPYLGGQEVIEPGR